MSYGARIDPLSGDFQERLLVETKWCPEKIEQEVLHELDGMRRTIIRNVCNLQDAGIRHALIALGWSPPPQEAKP
jgi:hypothetical protein